MRHTGSAGQRFFFLRYDDGAWEFGGTLPVYPTNGDTVGLFPDQGVLIRMGVARMQFGIRDSANSVIVATSDTIGVTALCSPCSYAGPYSVDICGQPAGQYRLHAVSARELLLLGTDAVQRSIDAGATWSTAATVDAQEPVALRFNLAGTIGYAIRTRSVYRTTDDGRSWSLQAVAPPLGVNARFAAVGEGERVVLAVDSVKPTSTAILFSNNGFSTSASGTLLAGQVEAMEAQPGGAPMFFACGLFVANGTDSIAKLWKSDNGGASWSDALASRRTKEFAAMAFNANGGAAVIFGRPGDSIPGYFTVDRGGNWLEMQPLAEYALPCDRIREVRFFDDSTALALGDNGRILRSTDYGLSWTVCSDLRAAAPGFDWSATAFALQYLKPNEHGSFVLTRDKHLWRDVLLSNAPKLLSVVINGGDSLTIVRNAQLSIQATNAPAEYIASEDTAFAGASWQAFATNPAFLLSAGDGRKTVYVKLRNADGESDVASDDILYENRFLTIEAPAAADSIPAGSLQEIRWSSARVANVTIHFSDDGGSTWTLLADSIDASVGRWSWRVYGRPSVACRVRIADAVAPSFASVSGDFTVLAAADNALLRSFAPVLYFHQENADRGWYPKECRVLTAQGELIEYLGDNPTQPALVATFAQSPDELPQWNDGRYYLEYVLSLPANVSGLAHATTMYCRKTAAESDGRTVLQYWLFFPYHQADAAFITHEGDWQLIEVKLNAARTDFTDVAVRQHDWFRRYTKAQIATEDASHPVFTMARETQTPYASTSDPVAQGWQARLSGAAGLLSGLRPGTMLLAPRLASDLTVLAGTTVTEAQAQLFLGWLYARERQSGGDAARAALVCFESAQQPTPALAALYTEFAGLAAAHPIEALSMDQKLTQADVVIFPLADSTAPWMRWKGHWGKRGAHPWSSGPLGPAGDRAWDKPFSLQRIPAASIDAAPLDNSLKALLPSLWLQTERQLTLRLASPALLTVRSDSSAISGFPLGLRQAVIPRSYALRGYDAASGDTAQLVGLFQPRGKYVATLDVSAAGLLKLSSAWMLGDSVILGYDRQLAVPAGTYFQELLVSDPSVIFGPVLGLPPVLAFPKDDMQDVPVQTTFLWHGSEGADSYELEISKDSLFATTDVHQTGITDTTRAVVGLDHLTRYFWRVRSSHAYGDGAWSATQAFRTIISTPITPTLLDPADKSRDIPRSVNLIWGASQDAVSYHAQLSARADFQTTIVDTQNVAATQYPLGGLLPNATYYWRVRARNAAGFSAWAAPFSFTTVPVAPDPPLLTSPANNATGVPVTVTLQWNQSAGAMTYRLQVSTSAAFTTLLRDTANLITTSFMLTSLTNNTSYYWRVRAANTGGASAWTSAFRFTTIGSLPAVPALASPANGATGVPASLALSWNASSGALTYRVQVSTSATFATTVFDSAAIVPVTATVRNLSGLTQYFWRVNATNAVGSSAWSTVWNFTTVGTAPPAPVLVSPANNATGVALQPTLSWTGTPAVLSYRVQLSLVSTFATLVMDTANVTAMSLVTRVLNGGTKYYWRVNASNASGTSAWSTVRNFTTTAAVSPPDKVVLLLPANNATGLTQPVACSWSAAARAATYRIMIDTAANFAQPVVDSSSMTNPAYTAAVLVAGRRYYWRVAGINAGGAGPWSDTWNFRTAAPLPAAPKLLLPADRAVVGAQSQFLVWSRVAGASYRLQASTDSGFLRLARDVANLADTSWLYAGLRNDSTYFWRVNATTVSGTSPWATAFRFTVLDDEPPALSVLAPACDSVVERKGLLASFLLADEGSGIDSTRIRVSLDGHVLLDSAQARMYYNAATGRVEFPLDTLSFGVHQLAVRVADRLGNMTTLECSFTVGTQYGIVLGSGTITTNVLIYPNPGGGTYHITVRDSAFTSASVAVYSLLGSRLSDVAVSWVRDDAAHCWRLATPLDLSVLPPGRYYIALGNVIVHTLIKL